MKNHTFRIFLLAIGLSFFTSCFGDLDTVPIDEDVITSESFYLEDGAYKSVLGKIYAGLAVTGQEGPAGAKDLGGIDEGFSSYLRQYWYQQELTTDEAVIAWADATIKDFHYQAWTPSDVFINAFYNRVFYQIGICNEFLRQTSNEALDRREVSTELRDDIATYQFEARFMRALSYWHALDEFRNVPFVTEADPVGLFTPEQINAPELFDYVESELLDIENKIATVRTNEYGRADQGAVWMLLAKLYLNAKQYIDTDKYNECLTYCEKIINAGYSLEPEFEYLFLADNDHNDEVIFPIAFDGLKTQTWGGTTFIIRAGIGGELDPLESGVTNGWQGSRTTKQMVEKFGEIGGVIREFAPRGSKRKVYLVGDFENNEINKYYSITDDNEDKIYKGYQYFESDDVAISFALNPTTSGAYGDSDNDGIAEKGADPISVGPAGLYYIEFDKTAKTYIIEKRSWVASGTSLESDVNFEWDAELQVLKLATEINHGDLFFKANDSDLIRLSDGDGDGYLDDSADNIFVDFSGPIEILLDIRVEEFVYKISSTSYDRRGIFGTKGQSIDVHDISDYKAGYAVLKFKNVTSTGEIGSNTDFPDTDFPMFRLGDVYLMASEAILRGANGSMTDAASYFNKVRSRAFKSDLANLDESTLNLQEMIDERARELMWEGHRRTDLIRFDQFTTSEYLWEWKGGEYSGASVGDHRNIFPIPNKDLVSNPNLKQNPGY